MSDEIDQANDLAEQLRAAAEQEARSYARTEPGIGICLNCGVGVKGDARWCSPACRDDYEQFGCR